MISNSRTALVCFTGNSGLTDYSVSLARELLRLREVFFLTAESYDEGKYGLGIPVQKLFRRTRHYPLDVFRFAWVVFRTRPHFVVFQSWLKIAFLDALFVRFFRIFGIRCIITIHDLLPHYPRRWSAVEMTFFYRSFDGAVVHSKRQAESLRALGLNMPTLVVPHGVYDLFNTRGLTQPEARQELPELSADKFTALFFGFLDHRKGIAEFVDAAVRMRELGDFQFVIAGKAEQRPVVLEALERARGAGNVIVHDFTIPHEDVQRYFAACDVVVLPYLEGTTSGVLKLAMAFGKPIICTDIGDFPETLESWPGLMVDSRRLVDDLVAKLLMARDRGTELFEQGARHADDFRWDRIAQRYDEFVRSFEHEA